MKRILISGGAGFIGSHLCERLLDEGNDVICIDNYFTGHKSNIRHLLKHPNFEVRRHDIIYPYMAEVEEIYNLACPASPIYYQHDPIKTTQTSVIGAMNMLGMARYNRAKVLQASTSEVYGDPLVHPQTEDYWGHVNPLGLRSCYDCLLYTSRLKSSSFQIASFLIVKYTDFICKSISLYALIALIAVSYTHRTGCRCKPGRCHRAGKVPSTLPPRCTGRRPGGYVR